MSIRFVDEPTTSTILVHPHFNLRSYRRFIFFMLQSSIFTENTLRSLKKRKNNNYNYN